MVPTTCPIFPVLLVLTPNIIRLRPCSRMNFFPYLKSLPLKSTPAQQSQRTPPISRPLPWPESMVSNSSSHVAGDEAGGEANGVVKYLKEKHCQFWLPNKRRHCANSPLPFSPFCGNHDSSASDHRLPCPLDPSHSVSKENLGSHLKKCPSRTQALALEAQTYYSKGINCDFIDSPIDEISSDAKRAAIYALNLSEFLALVKKIDCLHYAIVGDLENSYLIPDACDKWFSRRINSKIPYQERHVLQQASILGNMENFGILHRPEELVSRGDKEGNVDVFVQERGKLPAVVEFGAGRGYLTHMLADSYGIKKIFLVERRAYKLKADRSLRQNDGILLERLKIDIEDFNLHTVESLKGHPYLAIGKHLCGNATDLTIKCCLSKKTDGIKEDFSSSSHLQGIALATCCHHLCQWKHYLNKSFFLDHGITNQDFHSITWFSSWAVDSNLYKQADNSIMLNASENSEVDEGGKYFGGVGFLADKSVEETIRNMKAVIRAAFGFKCKDIIDMGRVLWLREHGLVSQLVKYVPPRISPENHLLVAKFS
ncbi:hypothetical protein KSP39_PZI004156 [Platanthera zijinensis]|uniref:tRNA:m(4)X modification enzyme TRM13 n=1 Tax=Platanthera zijinensis TaxID=2320716 RepID=A0AAP0BWT4_9ASPA